MKTIYVFFNDDHVRIPFFDYDKCLFDKLIKSNMGHWEKTNQQYHIARSSYDPAKIKAILDGKTYVEVGKEKDNPVIVNGFITDEKEEPNETITVTPESEPIENIPEPEGELPDQFPEHWREKMETEMHSRNYSPNTRSAYIYHNKLLCKWLQKVPEDITSDDIKRYLAYLERVKKQSASTLNFALSAFRFFYRQVMKRDTAREQKRPRHDVRLPTVYAKSEIKKILNIKNLKHRMMLMMTYDSGFRVGELVSLRKKDIDIERKVIIVHSGKGRKDRKTVISNVVIDMLAEYCKQYQITGWLFPGQDPSKHISVRTAQKINEHAIKKANIGKNGSFHSLRHTFATHLLERGTAITHIRDLLGHSSVRTTERYTRIANIKSTEVPALLDSLDIEG
jgi:site-specific recombinase XerD